MWDNGKWDANKEVGDGGGLDGWVGDFGDNPLWLFQAYHDAMVSPDPEVRQLADRANVILPWQPNSGLGMNAGRGTVVHLPRPGRHDGDHRQGRGRRTARTRSPVDRRRPGPGRPGAGPTGDPGHTPRLTA
ncbi:MAG TPA: hypothetical protein VFX16_33700 [Pseudonocardiaceae bacterium]|nr:hypothetical protein [Pseudonocardiaceae bacterium]